MTENQRKWNEILKEQQINFNVKAKVEQAKKEYMVREQDKFKDKSLIEFMHTPKGEKE